jgi:hypothetical protein
MLGTGAFNASVCALPRQGRLMKDERPLPSMLPSTQAPWQKQTPDSETLVVSKVAPTLTEAV